MQSHYLLLLLAIGAIGVTANEETNEIEKPVKGSSKKKYEYPPIPTDPTQIPKYMLGLERNLTVVSETTRKIFANVEAKMESRKKRMKKTIINNFSNVESSVKASLTQELEEAKEKGSAADPEKIETCVKKEHSKMVTDLNNNLERALTCIEKAVYLIQLSLDHAKKPFDEQSYTAHTKAVQLRDRWSPCTNSLESNCLNDVVAEMKDLIKATDEVAATAIKKARKGNRNHKIETDVCNQEYSHNITERREKHAQILEQCSANPTGA